VADQGRFGRRDDTAHGRDPQAVVHPPGEYPPDPVHQLDPFGGSVVDSGPVWSRRHRRQWRQTGWVDPAPHVGESLEAPVQPSPLRARATAARRHFLPLPIENIDRHLGAGEEVLHHDRPALAWFLVNKLAWVFGLAVLVAALLVSLLKGWEWAALIFGIGAVVVVVALSGMRLDDRYTAYVITNARMIRMSGVLRNDVESIPWVRVTDVHFQQSFVERLLGYATLHIESANENTGLRQMSGIDDFESFTRHLTDMIVAKQGATTPLGRRSDYTITPVSRGLVAFRRKQREQRVGSALVVDGEDGVPPTAAAAQAAATEAAASADTLVGQPAPAPTPTPAPGPTPPPSDVPRVRVAEPDPEPDLGEGPVTTARMAIPGRLRRKRPDDGTPAPDPALPQDLSDMSRVARSEMAADRRRQDDLLGRTGAARAEPDDVPEGRDGPVR
jgi:membrane protein YdbS with pleckstrin-like domain